MNGHQTNAFPYFAQQSSVPPSNCYDTGSYPVGFPFMESQKVFANVAPGYGESANSDYGNARAGGMNANLAFSDKTIRNGFIRKVYSILMCQLSISAAFIALFVYNDNMKLFAQKNPSIILIAFIITIVCLLAMSCFESARRQAPTNYIFLFIFTIAESFFLGVVSSVYKANEVVLAVGICAVICFGLTVFSFQTKIDFTRMGGILFIAVFILFIFGISLMFWKSDSARLVYACFGAFLFSMYLIYDTQLMIGGDHHKYSISPEDYVFAALNLYIDVIQLFLMILSILGSRD